MVDVVMFVMLDDEQFVEVVFGFVIMLKLSNVLEEFIFFVVEMVVGVEIFIEQVRVLENFLVEGGFFSYGFEGEVFFWVGYIVEWILIFVGVDKMIGDDEQYVVVMVLFVGQIDIFVCVVMGYYFDEEQVGEVVFEVIGDNVYVWVEVNFDGIGWVIFNFMLFEDQVFNDQNIKLCVDFKLQVLQLLFLLQEFVDLLFMFFDDCEFEDESLNFVGIIGLILLIGGIFLVVIVLFVLLFIVIGVWKVVRCCLCCVVVCVLDCISGGWDEFIDCVIDYGVCIVFGGICVEEVVVVVFVFMVLQVIVFVECVDVDVFGFVDLILQDVEMFWNEVDEIVGGFGKDVGFWKCIKVCLSMCLLFGGIVILSGLQNLKEVVIVCVCCEFGIIEDSMLLLFLEREIL